MRMESGSTQSGTPFTYTFDPGISCDGPLPAPPHIALPLGLIFTGYPADPNDVSTKIVPVVLDEHRTAIQAGFVVTVSAA